MPYLILVSIIWAFSFGIIGNTLANVPSPLTSAVRLFLALLLFAPFFRRTAWRDVLFYTGLGAVQFGGMYLAYNEAFKTLASHQAALLTITTPLWIAVLEGARGKFAPRLWQAVALATLGAGICAWKSGASDFPLAGFLLMQASNFCFALGQWAYRVRSQESGVRSQESGVRNLTPQFSIFAWMYLGAFFVALPFALPHVHRLPGLGADETRALCYLGFVASGLCFFLWNFGVRRVTPGRMAVMNDLKIPLAVLASVLFFREQPDWPRFAVGGILMALGIISTRVDINRPKSTRVD